MFDFLDKYDRIALDYDGTLYGNSDNIYYLIDYISNNKHKTYYIVTFRSEEQGIGILDVLNKLYVNYDINWNDLITEVIFAPIDIAMSRVYKYTTPSLFDSWKADVCIEHNLQVLIDDEMENVYNGCLGKGVDYFDICNADYYITNNKVSFNVKSVIDIAVNLNIDISIARYINIELTKFINDDSVYLYDLCRFYHTKLKENKHNIPDAAYRDLKYIKFNLLLDTK